MAPLAPPKGSLPVLQYCTPAQLAVDPAYQRDLDGSSRQLIARIAAGWDWNLCPPLVVARRLDRSLWIVDGQHRWEGAKLRGDIAQLPCVIFEPADPADEAAVFVELNQARRPLTPYALWKAALTAGDDQAMALNALLAEQDLRFSGQRNVDLLKPGQINGVGIIRKWHRRHGDAATRATLTALARAARMQPSVASTLFAAIGAVVLDQGDKLLGHLLGDVVDLPIGEWQSAFHTRAATDGTGIQAAAIAVVADAYAEALREIEDDEPAAPTPAEPPRGPADPRTRGPADPRTRGPAKIDLGKAPSSMEQRAGQWSGRE